MDDLRLVHDEGDRDPKFNPRARLALRNPARLLVENREDVLRVRYRLAAQQLAFDLLDLTPGMCDKALDGLTGGFR